MLLAIHCYIIYCSELNFQVWKLSWYSGLQGYPVSVTVFPCNWENPLKIARKTCFHHMISLLAPSSTLFSFAVQFIHIQYGVECLTFKPIIKRNLLAVASILRSWPLSRRRGRLGARPERGQQKNSLVFVLSDIFSLVHICFLKFNTS